MHRRTFLRSTGAAAAVAFPSRAPAQNASLTKITLASTTSDDMTPILYYNEVAWATTKDYSSQQPDIVRVFVRAYGEPVTYTNAHHAETVPLIAAYTTIDPAIISRMTRVQAWPSVTVAHLQPLIDACVKYGFLKARFPAMDVIDVNAR